MLDFTSALYLGLEHASGSLDFARLTTGKPAALSEPPAALRLASRLASLVGCERAVLAPSTLHSFYDVFDQLAARDVWVCRDEASYPIANWGLERAVARGIPARTFRHLDSQSLADQLLRAPSGGRRPVVVTDGFCPGCGRHAPVLEYLELVEARGGLLMIDDTQALGVFGRDPTSSCPLGLGGGGSLARAAVYRRPAVVMIASLAKAFGAPIALLAGSSRAVERVEGGATRTHCSPPSLASIAAAERALCINARTGDALRERLTHGITRLRAGLREQRGLCVRGGYSPVQRVVLNAAPGVAPVTRLYARLSKLGVQTVLQRARCERNRPSVSFLLTARHRSSDIDSAVASVLAATAEIQHAPT